MTEEKKTMTKAELHGDEVADIIKESAQRVTDLKLEGRELLKERQACSQAIAAATDRHCTELNAVVVAKTVTNGKKRDAELAL